MKYQFPLWQITLPLCGVLIFAIGAFTAFHMVNGRYLFYIELTPQGLRIKTDVDKRENLPVVNKTELEEKDSIVY
ncbi:MAG: hypothetical protein WA919_07620 [Coleofasciculaceae cyanobacterium]